MQKILYIGYVWPEPNSSAAGSRTTELLKIFRQQGWQTVFASAAALSDYRADLSALQIQEQQIVLNCDSFDIFLQNFQPEMVVFDRFLTEEQFGWRVENVCPHALRVLETCDLHSLREARHHILKKAQQPYSNEVERQQVGVVDATATTLFEMMATDAMALREIAAIYRCDVSLLISEVEADLLRTQFGVPDALLVVTNVILAQQTVALPSYEQRQHFISIGNFRHAPNWDAVLWLKHVIWPMLRAQLPQAQLHIYGAYPPPKAMQLHAPHEGFHVLGWAKDAQQVMAQARVCLAPLRFGAGLKGKLADAMACGTPSVTTTIGSEGMHGDLPWGGAVANAVDAMVTAAVNLYRDEAAWQLAQSRSTTILKNYFCRETSASRLITQLLTARTEQAQRRQHNFIGSMLRHHAHKSTQYMSQWIAEKNKNKI